MPSAYSTAIGLLKQQDMQRKGIAGEAELLLDNGNLIKLKINNSEYLLNLDCLLNSQKAPIYVFRG
jgi:hypothetical protein